jgi:hypothetical protein
MAVFSAIGMLAGKPFASVQIDYLLIAGGGAGGAVNAALPNRGFDYAGGGGAGGYISGSTLLSSRIQPYSFNVGKGGLSGGGTPLPNSNGLNGGDTTFLGLTAFGGGGGAGVNSNGLDGGSGGGGDIYFLSPKLGGSGSVGQGFNGGRAVVGDRGVGANPRYIIEAGSGGGANSNAISPTITGTGPGQTLVNGSIGAPKKWLDDLFYSAGGRAYNSLGDQSGSLYGNGGKGYDGSGPAPTGQAGTLKIRYQGSGSILTGGTITYDSGSNYTYHTYTSSGSITFV